MFYPTAEDWGKWAVTADLHRLFALFWAEMFSLESPDTWQVRTTNVISGLEELLDAIEAAEEHERARSDVPPILEEILLLTKLDPVVRDHFPQVREYLEDFAKARRDAIDLDDLGKTAELLLTHLGQYRDCLNQDLRELLVNGDPKQKERLNRLTLALGTEVVRQQYTVAHLRDLTGVLLDADNTPFDERFDRLVRATSGDTAKYRVYFPLPLDMWQLVDRLAVEDVDFVRLDTAPPVVRDSFSKPGAGAEHQRVARVRAETVDPHVARRYARERIEDLCSVFNLYRWRGAFRLRPEDALVGRSDDDLGTLGKEPLEDYYARDARNAPGAAQRYLDLHLDLHEDDAEQLAVALHHHRIGLSAPTNEARLLNLWIAIESLVRRERGSIIQRVCSSIPPVLALRNVRKIVRGFAIYLRMSWRNGDPSEFLKLFPNSKASYLVPDDLLTILLRPDDDADLLRLFDLCSHNPLFSYRMYRLRNKVLGSPKNLARYIERHHQNVSWQLRRLYRTRNEITHRGHTPKQLPRLLMHLHSYLVETVYEVMFLLDRHRDDNWSIPVAFHDQRKLYAHYVKCLKAGGTGVTARSLMIPRRMLSPASGEPVWPEDGV